MNVQKPILVKDLELFKKENSIDRVIDEYEGQLKELFLIRNPQYRFNPKYQEPLLAFIQEHKEEKLLENAGAWFYFPWGRVLVHYLPDAWHQELRTARNKNIITVDEQKKYYKAAIGIAGLSVGSHAAFTISMMGGAKIMKIADPDVISGSNLNRIRYDFTSLGVKKCQIVLEKLYQMNPYGAVYVYDEGITEKNIDEFLSGLDVLVEEMDNLEMKIRLRLEAKKRRIPVVMATDNGDGILFDIERYDLDPTLKIFNGVVGDLTIDEFKKISPSEMPRLSTKIAGQYLVHPRMQTSLLEVGKTLYAWPQLGSAATLSGVAVAYVVKRILLGEKLKTGKLEVNLDALFDPDYYTTESVQKRSKDIEHFLKTIGLT